ncbi:MAG: HlyD family efflux transporter periplasmic adaptor subunit [Synergistaceae bacterium]|nr:HlyD family efflux transporter periplasmic adaptor subunit [Synergistaceae bacterium]
MKKRKILFALILAGVVLGLLYRREELRDGLARYLGGEFRPGKNDEMKLFGSVEYRQALLGFRVSGRLAELRFEEGERVTAGALMAALDPVPYEIQRDRQVALLAQAQANLRKMSRGSRPEEIRQAVAGRNQVRASLNLAEADYKRMANLYAQGAVSKQALDGVTSSRDQLRAQLTSMESALNLAREGYRTEDVEAAAAAADVAETQLREAENALADTKLYAPSEGTLLTRVAEPGTILAAGQTVCALQLARPLQVRAYVSEPQLGKIRMGMRGKICTDASSDFLWGTVSYISPEAEFTPKQVQTEDLRTALVYRIRLQVEEDSEGLLKNGMPVTVLLERESGTDR